MYRLFKTLDTVLTFPFLALGYICCAIITTVKYGGRIYIKHLEKGFK